MREQSPTISVVMSVYKEPIDWMKQSIDSILKQTFTDFEFIIINDCPERDENRIVLEDYQKKDQRIVVIKNEENIGLTKSLNKGLSIAKGEYIARMDADDVSFENRFWEQVDYMTRHPEISVCHSDFYVVDGHGDIVGRKKKGKFIIQSLLFIENYIAHPTIMLRREILSIRKPLYNEQYLKSQDYELWACLTLNGCRIDYLPQKLLKYRMSDKQISCIDYNGQLERCRIIRNNLIREYLGKDLQTDKSESRSLLDYLKATEFHLRRNKNDFRDICQIRFIILYSIAVEKRLGSICYLPKYYSFSYCGFKKILRIFMAAIKGNVYPLYYMSVQ